MTERLGLAIAFIQFHQHSLLIVKELLLSKVCFSCLVFHIYQNIIILNSLPFSPSSSQVRCVVLREPECCSHCHRHEGFDIHPSASTRIIVTLKGTYVVQWKPVSL